MMKERYTLKDFLPLVVIFAGILITSLFYGFGPNGGLMHFMRDFMGLFFVIFGLLKVFKLKAFVEVYAMYDVVAMKSKSYAFLYPFIELFFGFSYLSNWNLETINYITLVVMMISAYGVYKKLIKREKIMCACLGTVFKVPMTWVTLIEDLLMAAMALSMIIL